MRMSPEKVKDLADQIVAMMAEHAQVHLNEDANALKVAIGGVILDDLEEEDDIEGLSGSSGELIARFTPSTALVGAQAHLDPV